MPDPRPTITVGLPVYNDPDGLRASVPTVFQQSWQGEIRLLVVDDGSTDDTPAVLAELQRTYPNINVVTNPQNLGRPTSRNRVLEEVGEGYLAWIDSDDLWNPRKLELQMAALLAADPEQDQPLICTTPFRWVYSDRNQEQVKVPDTSGDQLRNALSGSLQPYLWAMLGRVETFRQVGGFDERLPRRQDYEFFLRFLDGGGRVICTDPDKPLCTYMKTDLGRSSVEIAAANAVIEQKHQHLYERYGKRFTLEGRRKHHLLVARFQEHNGERLKSRTTSLRARALNPLIWAAEPMTAAKDAERTAKGLYWRTRRRAIRARSVSRNLAGRGKRLLVRLLGGLRRRAGGASALARDRDALAAARSLFGRHPIQTIIRDARAAARREPVADAIAAAEQRLGPADVLEREVWLALEQGYRDRGLLWSAEQALLAGLSRLPGDARLGARYVELLSLRRDWEACVQMWETLEPDVEDHRYAMTYTRAARAYLQLDRPRDAFAVTEEALQRWPNDDRLLEESYKGRAATTDWTAAIDAASPPGSGVGEPAPVGNTTSLGFLDGGEGPLIGHVLAGTADTADVELHVNGVPIARTSTRPLSEGSTDAHADFSLSFDELARFLGDGDVLEVRCGGGSVALAGYGERITTSPGHRSRTPELFKLLGAGHTFNKFGQLRPGNTPQRKQRTLDLYDDVSELIHQMHDLTCFPLYGNLLGVVRDHDFLPHDVGGFDMGYLSSQPGPAATRQEFLDICERLLEAGLHLTLEPYSAMIRRRHNDRFFLDLNYAWTDEQGRLGLSYGWRYAQVTDIERFSYPRKGAVADRLVRIPGNAEEVLERVYGPGWLVPDQGFQLEEGLKRDDRYLLTLDEMGSLELRWPDHVRLRGLEPEDP